jgi:hypothetical protein
MTMADQPKPPFPPKFLKARMYEKRTKTGDVYFTGTDGLLRTFMFKDNKNSTADDMIWLVYVSPRSEEEIAQRREQNAAKYGGSVGSHSHSISSPNYVDAGRTSPPQPQSTSLNDWIPF